MRSSCPLSPDCGGTRGVTSSIVTWAIRRQKNCIIIRQTASYIIQKYDQIKFNKIIKQWKLVLNFSEYLLNICWNISEYNLVIYNHCKLENWLFCESMIERKLNRDEQVCSDWGCIDLTGEDSHWECQVQVATIWWETLLQGAYS